MYRVEKVLNHNSMIGIDTADNKEYLLLGKGIGFGKKVTEQYEKQPEDKVYALQKLSDRGAPKELLKEITPECLELANQVLNEAEAEFGSIDRNILFPMADHLEYAIRRIRNKEQISNPLTSDIQILFYREYKVAQCIKPLLLEKMGIQIDEHELGYIALHIHSAIDSENVNQAMQMAWAVRECISVVEQETGKTIDVTSLAYNRLMNHVRYMVARAASHESLKVNMNDYIAVNYPASYETATIICDKIGKSLHCELEDIEIGYLAMHIERVADSER